MKISVSNIAWGKKNFANFLKLLKNNSCDGVELAPSLIWDDPAKADYSSVKKIKKLIKENNLELVGFHSLLFNKPDLLLFNLKTRKKTLNYLRKIIDLCSDLDARQIVFGSPKNRAINNRSFKSCWSQALEDMSILAEYSKKKKIIFCIEPLSKIETKFLSSIEEGANFVNQLNHPFFKLNLDVRVLCETKENPNNVIKNNKKIIQHVHISDKGLTEPGSYNHSHKIVGKILKNINYKNYLSLEIRRNEKDCEDTIKRSINYIKKNYLNA